MTALTLRTVMALAAELKQMWGLAGYGGDQRPEHCCDEE